MTPGAAVSALLRLVKGRRKLVLVAGTALVLLFVTGGIALVAESPPERRTEAPEYPLEFPSDVFRSPEPLPQRFQPIEVGEPSEEPEAAPAAPPGGDELQEPDTGPSP